MEIISAAAPTTASPHSPKRSAAQRSADASFIQTHVIRGRTQAEIVDLLAKVRPYRISRAQVAYDVAKLKALWIAEAMESHRAALALELRKLDAIEREAWSSWDESKLADTGANPVFTKQVLEVHDRRVRLLGISAPLKIETSGPNGSPVRIEATTAPAGPIDDAQKLEILRRHVARLEAEKAAIAAKDTVAMTPPTLP